MIISNFIDYYSGEIGVRKTSLGGRYDYTFDAHDRLTVAAYTPAPTADVDFAFDTVSLSVSERGH